MSTPFDGVHPCHRKVVRSTLHNEGGPKHSTLTS